MTSIPPSQPPEKSSTMNECKHPRVQIVAREEDAEFVECVECGDIFESSEFKDMMIEDTRPKNEP
jgi:Zn ribbon nucleic-acid-binding protein